MSLTYKATEVFGGVLGVTLGVDVCSMSLRSPPKNVEAPT